ncbi:alpha/beta fold hydrolase [Pseudomonas segetis]|uniref:Epoxide hydrolase. Serine peptidase. MEROPS family S33 n=1 Tax=Pseudomonas segetis TaxID=298908 RepID=A0A239AEJ5_9PSED|nr:alpha/beta hydrolase [Pseudomonas segetis]SNR93448.1 epoxide hydrolase. Serine peptidase. MEROPS family S33 [Pseudomonas segetis]
MSSNIQELRLRLPHIELAAQVYGPTDGKPVLALHGWLDNAATFARLAPKLEGLRIVALDLAGHGLSGHRPGGVSYAIWDYVYDVLAAAEFLEWETFSIIGHSMGAIVGVLLAGALPERIERLALIDGVTPHTLEAEAAPQRFGDALMAQMQLAKKRKTVHPEFRRAVEMRMNGMTSVSLEAAQLLAARGLIEVAGGYSWSADSRLTLPSKLLLTQAQAMAFAKRVACPVSLVVAEQGILLGKAKATYDKVMSELDFEVTQLPGGHHLHLDDERGAQLVADCFNRFMLSS